jgi:hypothetical protein
MGCEPEIHSKILPQKTKQEQQIVPGMVTLYLKYQHLQG